MLIALAVLLVALVAVVLKDWDFWFPSTEEAQETATLHKAAVAAPNPARGVAAAPLKGDKRPAKLAEPTAQAPLTATTERAALPPLQVEVVAGNRHTKVAPKNSAIHLDMDFGAATQATETPNITREP